MGQAAAPLYSSTVTVILSSDSEEPLLSERVSELSTMPQLYLLGGLPADS